VKNEQGEVFGPVGLETLREWARDGRLSPVSVVSEDAVSWSPVAQVAELEMDWVAEVSPGVFYGPIHYQALKELQGDGTLAPAAVLFTRNASANAQRHAEAAEMALAECVGQAEEAQKWLTAQVAQLTAQLAERDARLRHFEQQAADVNILQLLAQEIISAQEIGTRQVLDAVASAQASAAGQSEVLQEIAARQVTDRKMMLDAVADAREEVAVRVVREVSSKLPTEKPEHVADAHAKAVERMGQTLCDAVAGLAHDVKAGQGQLVSAVGDSVAPLTRQVQQLSGDVQALKETLAEGSKVSAHAPKVERVYVEAEAVEVIPPQPSAPHEPRAKPKPASPKAAPPAAAGLPAGVGGSGLSMAELEQQAQRELERLGAQGVNLFKRTK